MSIERISTIQTASVITQPVDAVERLTLVEKLEQELAENCRLNNWDLGFKAAIAIVKQHSDWVPCSERMPNDGENVLFHSIHSRTVSLGCRNKYAREYLWDIADSCGYELDRNISHWQPLPQPPSEVQGD